MLGWSRSSSLSACLLGKCWRADPGATRTPRSFCNSPLPLSPGTGRKWPAPHCCSSLDPAAGGCAIDVPDLGCERSIHFKLAARRSCVPPVEQWGFQPFPEKLALLQCLKRTESPNKSKYFKATDYLKNESICYPLNFFLRHYSALFLRELPAPVFKLGETDTRSSAGDSCHSLSVRDMEAVTSKTLEDGNIAMPMDCDQQSSEELQRVSTPESDAASVRDSPAHTDCLLSHSNAKDFLQNDVPEGTHKTVGTEKKRLKPRQRKKNAFATKNEINSLLAELPFPQAEIRAEYGFTTASEKISKKKRKRTSGGENEEDIGRKKKEKGSSQLLCIYPNNKPKVCLWKQALIT
ncbi:uncharacterized protein LOC119967375 isoform X1 [Scyliorhinus canicula]|uniref:uncharacterized protein LOC119967375 isoform X1 n=1 Tax=Scyliorhinus canicula TaxID=7830 RepID=UPI0018F63F7B|nr:uncharacterized protein LOC119967375 isoform X1 [Scyliorhinus canicula]